MEKPRWKNKCIFIKGICKWHMMKKAVCCYTGKGVSLSSPLPAPDPFFSLSLSLAQNCLPFLFPLTEFTDTFQWSQGEWTKPSGCPRCPAILSRTPIIKPCKTKRRDPRLQKFQGNTKTFAQSQWQVDPRWYCYVNTFFMSLSNTNSNTQMAHWSSLRGVEAVRGGALSQMNTHGFILWNSSAYTVITFFLLKFSSPT